MELSPYVESLKHDLTVAATAAGQDQRLVGLLATAVEPAVRLAIMDALSAASAEITGALGDATVEIRLVGRDPQIVVTPIQQATPEPLPAGDADEGTARITLRLPEGLKTRVEQLAADERVSVNHWLVRALRQAAEPQQARGHLGRSLRGYAR